MPDDYTHCLLSGKKPDGRGLSIENFVGNTNFLTTGHGSYSYHTVATS
jgi:hypothetical protein